MPPDVRSGPQVTTPGSRLNADVLAKGPDLAIVTDGRGRRQGRRSAPPMRVSLFAPAGRRTWWWFTGRCLRCGTTSFGRVRHEEDAAGVRRVSCGHRVRVIVARTYRLPESGAAA